MDSNNYVTKEELKRMIKSCSDERICTALWELYDLKFTENNKPTISVMRPMWWKDITC